MVIYFFFQIQQCATNNIESYLILNIRFLLRISKISYKGQNFVKRSQEPQGAWPQFQQENNSYICDQLVPRTRNKQFIKKFLQVA